MEDVNTQSGNPRAMRGNAPAEAPQDAHDAGAFQKHGCHAFEKDQRSEGEGGVRHKVLTGIGVALCVLLIPIVLINCTLIIKQTVNKDEVPSVGGIFPMIVLTDSMAGTFNAGSLIVCGQVSAEDVRAGDIICFFDPSGNGTTTTTHRVQKVKNEGGAISFITKGDANNTADTKPVPSDKLVGRYIFHIEGLGNLAMFMQTTPGLIIFAVLPILVLVAYDVLRRRAWDKKKDVETDALLAELSALRAQRDAKLNGLQTGGEQQQAASASAAPGQPQPAQQVAAAVQAPAPGQVPAPWQGAAASAPAPVTFAEQAAQARPQWAAATPAGQAAQAAAPYMVKGGVQGASALQNNSPQAGQGAAQWAQPRGAQATGQWVASAAQGATTQQQPAPGQWEAPAVQPATATNNPRKGKKTAGWQP